MIRYYVKIDSVDDWYAIMHECQQLYGKNWRGQKKVKKKLIKPPHKHHMVWFEVPDETFFSWIGIKFGHEINKNPVNNILCS